MDQVLKEKKISRKQLAARSGLSQDYLYKLLRGDKKTNERDYALAICIAAGMNLSQAQYVLRLLGMPTLSDRDMRSHIIKLAIMDNRDIDETNEWLEKAGYYQLKTSPDMPSSEINILSSGDDAFDDDVDDGDYYVSQKRLSSSMASDDTMPEYREVSRQIEAEPSGGNAPFDYVYWGIICVENDKGQKYYVEASYSDFGSNFVVLDEANKQLADQWMLHPEEENPVAELEQYESLEETAVSDFFRYFLIIDRETDKKVIEIMDAVDDTKNYGFRCGFSWGAKQKIYCEGFNTVDSAEMLYLQIEETKDGFVISASHKSYYMWMELGDDLYEVYFGKSKDREYLFKVSRYEDIPEQYKYLFPIFKEFRYHMNETLKEAGAPIFMSEDEFANENIDVLLRMGTSLLSLGNYEEALSYLLQTEEAVIRNNDTLLHTVVCYRIALAYEESGLSTKAEEYYKKAYDSKDLLKTTPANDDLFQAVHRVIAEIAYHYMVKAHETGDILSATAYCKEIIDLMNNNCSSESDWLMLSSAYTNLAGFIESENPNLSAEYGEKSIQIIVEQGLDRNDDYVYETAVKYNNHAWVLWNLLQRTDAEFYYRRHLIFFPALSHEKAKRNSCRPF